MKLLHIADIHLDRVFRNSDTRHASDTRRAELRDALRRAFAIGESQCVDAVCIAGDVYEHDYVREDTVAFLRDLLAGGRRARADHPRKPRSVPAGIGVAAHRSGPANVHVFAQDRIEAVPAQTSPPRCGVPASPPSTARPTPSPAGKRPADGGTHLLLIHGALTGEQWADDPGHRPFTRAQLTRNRRQRS